MYRHSVDPISVPSRGGLVLCFREGENRLLLSRQGVVGREGPQGISSSSGLATLDLPLGFLENSTCLLIVSGFVKKVP